MAAIVESGRNQYGMNIMFSLTSAELKILSSVESLPSVRERAMAKLGSLPDLSDKYNFDLSEAECQTVVEELQDLFSGQGLEADYEPNEFGRTVEALIDKLISSRAGHK